MKRLMIICMVALLAGNGTGIAQKQKPPEGGEPKDFVLPARSTFTLENGLRVTMIPYGTIPKVTLYAVVRTGHIDESKDQVWLSDLLGEMMKEGTAELTPEELARETANIGGTISVAVGDDRVMLSADALGEDTPRLISLVAGVLKRPRLPEGEFERVRNNLLRRLSVEQADPQAITFAGFREALYGDHPYGRTMPTEDQIAGYTLTQIRDFYGANFGGARTHLFIAGVFDSDAAEKAVRAEFSDWTRGREPTVNIPTVKTGPFLRIIDRPGAKQSTIYLGLPVIDPSKPDWIPLTVTNALLGGAFASRITANIREEKGYTYSPRSVLSTRYRDGYWLETADVSTEVTGAALKEIFAEIDTLSRIAPSPEELKGIQNNTAGIFVLQNSAPQMIVSVLAFMDLHGLADSYLANYIKNVHAVTPEGVMEMTGRYIRRNVMTVIVAGDRKLIEKQLRPFGIPSK